MIAAYSQIFEFSEIVPVSALKGENAEHLVETLFSYLQEGPQFYDEDTITDQPQSVALADL